MTRRRPHVRAACAALLLCMIAVQGLVFASAKKSPEMWSSPAGQLDASFGHAGRVLRLAPRPAVEGLPFFWGYDGHGPTTAIAPDGRIAVARGLTIFALNSDGSPDLRFGDLGKLSIAVTEGRQFQLAAIAFDTQGRLLVAGTAYERSAQYLPPAPPLTWAMLRRYLPDGSPDPAFGVGGTVETGFGLSSPSGKPTGSNQPSLEVTGLALDAHDGVVVTGVTATRIAESCYTGLRTLTAAFTARVSAAGSLDRSFGASGVVVDPNAAWAQAPVVDRFGRLVYAEVITEQCGHGISQSVELVALGEDGRPVSGFKSNVLFGALAPSPIAIDRRGRILLLSADRRSGCQKSRDLLRLTPLGALDRRFGSGGVARIRLHRCTKISALGVDSRGRPLVAGRWRWDNAGPSKFFLARLTTRGRLDSRFGHSGAVRTAFPHHVGARPLDVLVDDRDRILVGGLFGESHEVLPSGIALTRYLGSDP